LDNPYREPASAVIPYTDKEMELWDAMMVNNFGKYSRNDLEIKACEIIELRRAKFGVR
jgi:hypothetical protein